VGDDHAHRAGQVLRLIAPPTGENIARAAGILQQGGLAAFPTETVYGLGADASNPAAVAKIFAAKGRPQDHPLIVHLGESSQLHLWAREIPQSARMLAAHFWPGPLTIILKRLPQVSDAVTGGQDSVGLRVPAHPVAQKLLQTFGGGIAAPSANRFGRISPTTAAHVEAEFATSNGAGIGIILDGGPCEVGIESTIVDLSRGSCVVLRPGHVSASQIADVIRVDVESAELPADNAPRASGTLEGHYAPNTPLRLLPRDVLLREFKSGDAVLALGPAPMGAPREHWLAAPAEALAYAHDLYANLRRLDALGCMRMLVEQLPQGEAWEATADRLRRAEAGSG
jgi:L-threonylcarbamoyladenylate synthase